MYEHLRNDFEIALANDFSCEQRAVILSALDSLMANYELVSTEKAVTTYQPGEAPALVKTYIACQLVGGLSKQTAENETLILTRFFADVAKLPGAVNSNDVRLWLYSYKKERNISDQSAEKYRSYISAFYSWAVKEEYLSDNPCDKIPKIKYEQRERDYLTAEELNAIRSACETKRETAIIEFLYSTGARVSELCGTKISDIDFSAGTVKLFGKGRKERTSYLNIRCLSAIKAYLSARKIANEYLFISEKAPFSAIGKDAIEKIIRQISERASLPSGKIVTPHILRHTTATTALQNGMPVNEIQQLLGHSDISTTMIYAKTDITAVQASHKRFVV